MADHRSVLAPCPHCGDEQFFHLESRSSLPELLCAGCTRFEPAPNAPRDSLPLDPLAARPRSQRDVYRVLCEHGSSLSNKGIRAQLRHQDGEPAAARTVGRALQQLRRAGLVWRTASGWSAC